MWVGCHRSQKLQTAPYVQSEQQTERSTRRNSSAERNQSQQMLFTYQLTSECLHLIVCNRANLLLCCGAEIEWKINKTVRKTVLNGENSSPDWWRYSWQCGQASSGPAHDPGLQGSLGCCILVSCSAKVFVRQQCWITQKQVIQQPVWTLTAMSAASLLAPYKSLLTETFLDDQKCPPASCPGPLKRPVSNPGLFVCLFQSNLNCSE